MKLLKNRLFLAGMMIFILIAMAAPVFAADHNYQYDFHLQKCVRFGKNFHTQIVIWIIACFHIVCNILNGKFL